MKILICGECFSQNLGDGIIALAMKKMVRKILPDSTILFFDFLGRNGYGVPSISPGPERNIGMMRSIHRRLYPACHCYTLATNVLHVRILKKYGSHSAMLASTLADVDYVLIGGGQLLQDNTLAFPLAISALVKDAGRFGLPVSFFSVGVGKNWSVIGKKIIGNALMAKNIKSIICRDELSAHRLIKLFPGTAERLGVTYDVALAANLNHELQRTTSKTVGLCITHPKSIGSIDKNHPLNNVASAIGFWTEIYRGLTEQGIVVRMFSNGASEDDALARKIAKHIEKQFGVQEQICITRRPPNPNELIRVIGNFGLVVAYRLHANIVATILGIPCIALGWDAKVEEFMKYSGQIHRFVHANGKVSEIVDKVVKALRVVEPEVSTANMVDKMIHDLQEVLGGCRIGAA